MALINFEDLPSTATPLNANNLNNNFNYCVPTGGIVEYAGTTAPNGWLLCDGSAISRTTYADLFEVIGTTFGEGDGSTTFNLPNRKNKTGVGVDSSSTHFSTLGATYGEETHKLTIDEMPSHSHNLPGVRKWTENGTSDFPTTGLANKASENQLTYTAGGSQPHNNIQPSIAMNYIIKC